MSSSVNVSQLYQSVIADVINQVREPFLDEGIDPEVLQQLKSDWLAKVTQSGCVDGDGSERKNVASGGGRTKAPTNPPRQKQYPGGPAVGIPVVRHVSSAGTVSAAMAGGGGSGFQQTQLSQLQHVVPNLTPVIPPANTRYVVVPGSAYASVAMGVSGQQHINLAQSGLVPGVPPRPTATLSMKQPSQLDGAEDDSDHEGGSTAAGPSHSGHMQLIVTEHSVRGHSAKHIKGTISQLDGQSDSSDADDDEFEDEHVEKLMSRIAQKSVPEQPQEQIEEEPLNSGDDASDDEDAETMFDVPNVVVCQFEKVSRIRNRWKFVLKDGVMNINGKDHVFSRGNGEAEW